MHFFLLWVNTFFLDKNKLHVLFGDANVTVSSVTNCNKKPNRTYSCGGQISSIRVSLSSSKFTQSELSSFFVPALWDGPTATLVPSDAATSSVGRRKAVVCVCVSGDKTKPGVFIKHIHPGEHLKVSRFACWNGGSCRSQRFTDGQRRPERPDGSPRKQHRHRRERVGKHHKETPRRRRDSAAFALTLDVLAGQVNYSHSSAASAGLEPPGGGDEHEIWRVGGGCYWRPVFSAGLQEQM